MPAVAETDVMANSKRRSTSSNHDQYRKPARPVRVRERLAKQGDILAARLEKTLTEIVNDALRKVLEENGLWPPK